MGDGKQRIPEFGPVYRMPDGQLTTTHQRTGRRITAPTWDMLTARCAAVRVVETWRRVWSEGGQR